MEKRQQWIVGAIAILAALSAGVVVYSRFAADSDGHMPWTGLSGSATSDTSGTAVSDGEDPIPTGDMTTDEVVSGILEDLRTEEAAVSDEVSAEKDAAIGETKSLNEYENAYEESDL